MRPSLRNIPVILAALWLGSGGMAAAEGIGDAALDPDTQLLLPRSSVYSVLFGQMGEDTPFKEEGIADPAAPADPAPVPLATPDGGPALDMVPIPPPPSDEEAPPVVVEDPEPPAEMKQPAGMEQPLVMPYDAYDDSALTVDDVGPNMAALGGSGCQTSCSQRRCGVDFGGWIDQGITFNSEHPKDGFNGPVTFNDRDREYQLNQLWGYAERQVNPCGRGWDIGGRVDFFYGTDWRFTQAIGLEDRINGERFYGVSLPQAYVDVAKGDLTVRMGHYFTIIGYESPMAPENFFYSHSYTMQYGEPFTHTGVLASYQPICGLVVHAGADRGWNTWEDNNDDWSFLGGITGTSRDGCRTVSFAITSGDHDEDGRHDRTMYSFVFTQKLGCRTLYVLQHDYGVDQNGGFQRPRRGVEDAEWYGINQYLFYEINCRWSVGLRAEWFRDDDGARVGGIGAPHGWALGPDFDQGVRGWAGNFWEITLGYNFKPCSNVLFRQEFRWDWYDGPRNGFGQLPYDSGTGDDQFTFATDLIVKF